MSETTAAPGAADQARAKTEEAGAQAKEKAHEAGQQARTRVRDEVDRRSTQAGEQAGSTAQALRQASDRLREDGNEPVAKGIEQVAQRVDSAGSWLREADGDRILRDVEDFGRRNPLAVVAGGVALGFAVSRLLKASSRSRYEQSRQNWSGNGHATTPVASPGATTPVVSPGATTPVPPSGTTTPGTTPPPPSTGWREPDVPR